MQLASAGAMQELRPNQLSCGREEEDEEQRGVGIIPLLGRVATLGRDFHRRRRGEPGVCVLAAVVPSSQPQIQIDPL